MNRASILIVAMALVTIVQRDPLIIDIRTPEGILLCNPGPFVSYDQLIKELPRIQFDKSGRYYPQTIDGRALSFNYKWVPMSEKPRNDLYIYDAERETHTLIEDRPMKPADAIEYNKALNGMRRETDLVGRMMSAFAAAGSPPILISRTDKYMGNNDSYYDFVRHSAMHIRRNHWLFEQLPYLIRRDTLTVGETKYIFHDGDMNKRYTTVNGYDDEPELIQPIKIKEHDASKEVHIVRKSDWRYIGQVDVRLETDEPPIPGWPESFLIRFVPNFEDRLARWCAMDKTAFNELFDPIAV